MTPKNTESLSENEVKRIVRDHKVFWTTVPMQLTIDGNMTRVGISVALVGTDSERDIKSGSTDPNSVLDKLTQIANWMIPDDTPNVKIEIRRGSQNVFYRPEEFGKNWKRYAIGIRILHSDKFAQPFSRYQQDVYTQFQEKLKEIECPKEHWMQT